VSVRPSVRPSYQSTAAAVCGGFAAERRAGRRYRSKAVDSGHPAATTPQHGAAARRSAANADSALLTAELTRLNTDFFRLNYLVFPRCLIKQGNTKIASFRPQNILIKLFAIVHPLAT